MGRLYPRLTTVDCGMTHLTAEQIKGDIERRHGGKADTTGIDFGCFSTAELEKSIHDDVKALEADVLLRGIEVRGFVLTTETGLLREI
jgi:hypothetical protein